MSRSRLQVYYSGRVQGVGFRYTVKSLSAGYEVTGGVRNLADGRVELIAEGERPELEDFLNGIQESGLGALIRDRQLAWGDARGEYRGFEILA